MHDLQSRTRLVDQQRTRRRRKRFWPLLVLLLLGLNVYLFAIRGMPPRPGPSGSEQAANPGRSAIDPPGPEPTAATLGPDPISEPESSLGQMRGVAGIRDLPEPAAAGPGAQPHRMLAVLAQPSWPGLRFDLEQARSVAGQRSFEQWCDRIEGTVERGDHFTSALTRMGLAGAEVFGLVEALKTAFDFRRCRAGERFDALVTPAGRVHSFSYHVDPVTSYAVERKGARLVARKVERQADVKLASIGVRIDGSLWQSLAQAGEHGSLVMMIVDIFAWDIDFYVDTHPGDTIRLLVEKHTVDGRFVRYGQIRAAEYAGGVGVHRAFWYDPKPDDDRATQGYFDEQGGSLRKAFLKSPLKFARISSGFGMRVHPVLGFNKLHQGVDFAAPIGTPVWAPADGTVLFAGRQGPSGIMLKLRHANGYQTVYCHLNRIESGVRAGARVRQKQVIARVGNTGRSTGPHLHYGMQLSGRQINPLAQRFPPAKPVPAAERPAYQRVIAPLRRALEAIALPAADQTAAQGSASAALKDSG